MSKVSLDTNILIDNPSIVFDTTKEFVISFTVIRELDHLKRNPDLKRAAQQALKNIRYQHRQGKVDILNMPTELGDTPDERIINDTKNAGASFLTGDLGAELIANAFGIEISGFEADDDIDYEFDGYQTIQGDVEYEKSFVQIKEMQLEEFEETFKVKLRENEYCIIDRVIDKNDIWVNKKQEDGTNKVLRISQSMKPYRDAGVLEDPLDAEQMCALDAVFDPSVPLTIIDGVMGTGKTVLTLMSALASTRGQGRHKYYDTILVTRPPVSINNNMKLGYLPGTLEEKMGDWLGGIISNLKFLLEKTELDKEKEKAKEVFERNFDMVNIDSIQGTSLHNTILLVDEYQLLDEDTLKLILSRISKGSKVVLIGDTEAQTYGLNRANEGFKVLYKHLGEAPEMNFIRLKNIYRSALVKFVEDIFKH